MKDLVTYSKSVEEKTSNSVFLNQSWLQVLDSNNGSYSSSQATLETTSLASSDRFMDYREAYLSIPLLLTLGNNTNVNTAGLANATNVSKIMGLKNSYTSLIHSMSVDLNGTNIIQSTPFSELYNAFKLMTSFSWNDVVSQGATIGFYPDDVMSATAFTIDNSGGAAGMVVNNNDKLTMDLTSAVVGKIGNNGFAERLRYINYDADAKVGGDPAEVAQSVFLTKAAADQLYKSQVITKHAGGVSESPVVQTQVMAVVKLKHLHNYFQNVPMSKGCQYRFIFNLNQSTSLLTTDGTDVTGETVVKSSYNGVVPLMLASCLGSGAAIKAAAGSVRADLSVGNTCLDNTLAGYAGTTTGNIGRSIQLHVPSYVLNPSLEAAYISAGSNRKVVYDDVYSFTIRGVDPNQNVNQLVTSGIRGIKSVLLVPMLASDANGGINEFQSVQSSCGGGDVGMLHALTNFNIQVGGVSQLQNSARYGYELFNEQFYGVNAINGGQSDGLTSGLISQRSWEQKHGYVYLQVNRGTELEMSSPKSVQIQFQSLAGKKMDYYIFITYTTSINLDVGLGVLSA
ncbi:MAG: hypothetical protein O3C41_08605 [Bacteroidetes bacterium]|nr:hypothetical protein [Bacteroidota bacterium]